MDIYQKIKPLNYWEYKKYYSFYIPQGRSNDLIRIIKNLDIQEFINYFPNEFDGINETLEFHSGIWVKTGGDKRDYMGKFELNLPDFYKKCEEENLPVYIERVKEYFEY